MVTISFKSFATFKSTIDNAQINPDRIKPDRYFVTNSNGAVKKVAVVGAAGRVLLEYDPPTLTEIKPDDPWFQANPDKDMLAAIEVADIGESIP